ncbi:MAG: hypothetical protein M1838_003572 [Thelocarpon superellum]|nr:MAG: hypothetical protein M1838_003572 [Thelocarpon superellum]
MEIDLVPSTVYSPSLTGQARIQDLNTIIEEEASPRRPTARNVITAAFYRNRRASGTHPSTMSPVSPERAIPSATATAAGTKASTPASSSPSSSTNSDPLTWTSSETGGTNVTSFDDLYDASDGEMDPPKQGYATVKDVEGGMGLGYAADEGDIPIVIVRRLNSLSSPIERTSEANDAPKGRRPYPSLIIPPFGHLSSSGMNKASPVPPTPPPKIPMSPAILRLLTRDIPTSTAPPSLDGSLTSDQLAASPSPSTPSEGDPDDPARWEQERNESGCGGGGIQLNPEALATLQMLTEDHTEPAETTMELPTSDEPHVPGPQRPPARHDSDETITPATAGSTTRLTELDVPSPGGFFSSLGASSRYTWAPPSSATAEHFYRAPWNVPELDTIPPSIQMRRETSPSARAPRWSTGPPQTVSSVGVKVADEVTPITLGSDYDDAYKRSLSSDGSAGIKRTCEWLGAQIDLLASAGGLPDPAAASEADASARVSLISSLASPPPVPTKKMVRFVDEGESFVRPAKNLDSFAADPVFWHTLQRFIRASGVLDALVHSEARFDALQVRRLCTPFAHREQLLGKFRLRLEPVTKDPDEAQTPEHLQVWHAENERDAMAQVLSTAWFVMAVKMLNGGRLVSKPAAVRMAGRRPPSSPGQRVVRRRMLDLGGQSIGDWAWHCAEQFPGAKIYTVLTRALRLPTYFHLQGPDNHRQVAVPHLWRLPFPDGYFEVISARTLYMFLRTDIAPDESEDEYDLCLRECFRCLKPGGCLDFFVLDSDIINAGPLGSAMSIEFGFNLRTRGYDPMPTRSWVGRVERAGFTPIRRVWMVLPMGVPTRPDPMSHKHDGRGSTEHAGSTPGVTGIGHLSGLVGSLAWEKWMLKLQMESGKHQDDLLDGVRAVIEEGRECGAAWRCLTGWAKKPLDLERS